MRKPATGYRPRREDTGGLVLTRRPGEKIMIGDDIVIRVVQISDNKVRIGIQAPESVTVHREEVWNVTQGKK